MSENCVHKPAIRFGEFIRRYFQKDGILSQTFRCASCGGDVLFVKKRVYRVWDLLIWILLIGFMLLTRLLRDAAVELLPLWLYILIAVVLVSLLGLVLDIAKEWLLLKSGSFTLKKAETPEVKEEVQEAKEASSGEEK